MKTLLRLAFPFALISLFVLSGCIVETACTTEARSSVTVTVVDMMGVIVPDAVVTFSVDGAALETCEAFPDGMSYTCGYERDGQFAVTATKGADTKTQTVTIKMTPDGCHVDGQAITITLNG